MMEGKRTLEPMSSEETGGSQVINQSAKVEIASKYSSEDIIVIADPVVTRDIGSLASSEDDLQVQSEKDRSYSHESTHALYVEGSDPDDLIALELLTALDDTMRIRTTISLAPPSKTSVLSRYNIKSTYRDNNIRVLYLYSIMRDMQTAVLRLNTITRSRQFKVEHNSRLLPTELMSRITSNITDCSNVCDTYMKTTILERTIKGLAWRERLAAFIESLKRQRYDLELAIITAFATAFQAAKKLPCAMVDSAKEIADFKRAERLEQVKESLYNSCISMALQRVILRNRSQEHNEAILEWLKSESPLTACISYCSAAQSGQKLAYVILSTMQEMMNIRRTDTDTGERAIMRRTLVLFSAKVQVFPLRLFLQEVKHLEKEPRSTGDFADLFYGVWSGQYVAVKRLRTVQSAGSESSKNFHTDAVLWCELHHSSVLPVLGLEPSPSGTFCVVTPWMKQGNLATFLAEHRTVDLRQRSEWIRQVADGLDYLHSNQIVHGNLRGANVLLDDNLRARLVDFGLYGYSTGTKENSAKNNGWRQDVVRWTAPEVLMGGRCLLPGDVYSFGSVSLEIITGRQPWFNIADDMQVIHRVTSGESPYWSFSEDPVVSEIGRWILECWRKDPGRRPVMRQVKVGLGALSMLDSREVSRVHKGSMSIRRARFAAERKVSFSSDDQASISLHRI